MDGCTYVCTYVCGYICTYICTYASTFVCISSSSDKSSVGLESSGIKQHGCDMLFRILSYVCLCVLCGCERVCACVFVYVDTSAWVARHAAATGQ